MPRSGCDQVTGPAKINLSLLPVLGAFHTYVLAVSAAGKISTKDNANIWRKGKDASCRCRYNQVHVFLPRACCHYSFLPHANVQISLPLVKAHGVSEDTVPILKTQRDWEHSTNGVEALSCGRDPAPRDPISPRPHSVAIFSAFWESVVEIANGFGGGWAGGSSRAGWGAAGAPGTRVPPERISKGHKMSGPHGAGMAPLAGAAALTQKGLLGSPRVQKVALPPISDN